MKNFLIILLFSLFSFRDILAQSTMFFLAQDAASKYVSDHGLYYDSKRNIFYNKSLNNNIIHVFIYEDGNLLLSGWPTTATEKNKFVIHLFINSNNINHYLLEYTGNYSPVLNIQAFNNTATTTSLADSSPAIIILDFATLGPFTDNLILTLKRDSGTGYSTLTTTNIRIAKTIYASIGTGVVFTTLRSPSNIRPIKTPSGDTSLNADNTKGRSLLTVIVTFYPLGRNNLIIPGWDFKDRFGIILGTTIGSGTPSFQNLLAGVQYDFSVGGSIVTGLHYGLRQKIIDVDYNKFNFGESKFSGDLNSKEYMEGGLGFFVGVQLDNRIFSQLFPPK